MARLANTANLGFVPLPEGVADLIAAHIAPTPAPVRFFDPCAGEGVAAETIATAIGIPAERRYFNELHDERAKVCATRAQHVVSCDTLKNLQATPRGFQLGYLNPPFDHDGREEGGGRLEAKFFRRAIEEGQWIQPGGLAVLVTPQDVLARREIVNHLARCYDSLQIFAVPDAVRSYREAVVFGIIRERRRIAVELQREATRIAALLAGSLPVLTRPPVPPYHLPTPQPVKRVVWRDGSKGTPAMAQREVVQLGGAWRSPAYQFAQQQMHRAQLRPVFPLHKPQAALRIAAGAINGTRVAIADVPQVLKGSTVDQFVEWDESRSTDGSEITERHRIVRRVPHVVTVDETGTIRRFVGDAGMAELMRREGTAEALLSAVEESAQPVYRLDMEPEVAKVLGSIVSLSGRALPGYAPGLLPMQRHVAAALVRYLRTIHPAAVAALEMGCGKTAIGAAIAEVLFRLDA